MSIGNTNYIVEDAVEREMSTCKEHVRNTIIDLCRTRCPHITLNEIDMYAERVHAAYKVSFSELLLQKKGINYGGQ